MGDGDRKTREGEEKLLLPVSGSNKIPPAAWGQLYLQVSGAVWHSQLQWLVTFFLDIQHQSQNAPPNIWALAVGHLRTVTWCLIRSLVGSGCREPSTACGSPSSRSLDPIHAISSILFPTVFFLQLLILGGLNKWKDVYLFMKWQSANYPWQRHHQDWGLWMITLIKISL